MKDKKITKLISETETNLKSISESLVDEILKEEEKTDRDHFSFGTYSSVYEETIIEMEPEEKPVDMIEEMAKNISSQLIEELASELFEEIEVEPEMQQQILETVEEQISHPEELFISEEVVNEMEDGAMKSYLSTMSKMKPVEMLEEKTDLLGGADDAVTQSQLNQATSQMMSKIQTALASLGGGGLGDQDVSNLINLEINNLDSSLGGTINIEINNLADSLGNIIGNLDSDVNNTINIEINNLADSLGNIIGNLDSDTTAELEHLRQISSPVGMVGMWMAPTAPLGWLLLNGSSFDITEYPLLHQFLTDNFPNYSSGDLPDYRGHFPGGHGDLGMSSDLGGKTNATTGDPGVSVVSNGSHTHTATTTASTNVTIGGGGTVDTTSAGSHRHNVGFHKNKDNSSSNNGSSVNVTTEYHNNGSEFTRATNEAGGHLHKVDLSGISASGSTTANTTLTDAGDHSHTLDGWDTRTMPNAFAINFMIKHD